MHELILHPVTEIAVQQYIASPGHPILITGPSGAGKASLAHHLVQRIIGIDPARYSTAANIHIVRPLENKGISIEAVREAGKFLTLKAAGRNAETVYNRAIVIEDAHLMTAEAQNAFLKTLEEPPADTIIILTATGAEAVLQTIQSRVRQFSVLPPPAAALKQHFLTAGYAPEQIARALLISGELPGLTAALLSSDDTHPLLEAITHARDILRSKTYERLLLVDSLSKQKQLCLDICFVMGQMAHLALTRSTDERTEKRWQSILSAAYNAGEQLNHNAQTKLVLTNLMLVL